VIELLHTGDLADVALHQGIDVLARPRRAPACVCARYGFWIAAGEHRPRQHAASAELRRSGRTAWRVAGKHRVEPPPFAAVNLAPGKREQV